MISMRIVIFQIACTETNGVCALVCMETIDISVTQGSRCFRLCPKYKSSRRNVMS